MHPRAALALFALFFPVPALAAETDWVELAPDVGMRLVSSNLITDENTLWMAFEIDMPSDTKTYWRVPGESGIPLAIKDVGSRDLGPITVAWPFPKRENDRGYLDHSYYGHAVIPVEIAVEGSDPSVLIDVTLGICSDVCIPATARFDLAIDLGDPDTANGFRIRQALATVPQTTEAQDIFGGATFDPALGAVHLDMLDTQFDPASIIAELDGALTVFDTPKPSADGNGIVFDVLGRVPEDLFENATMRFSFETEDGAFETSRPLATQ